MKYSIILAVCVAFSLVGCGQKNEEKEDKKSVYIARKDIYFPKTK